MNAVPTAEVKAVTSKIIALLEAEEFRVSRKEDDRNLVRSLNSGGNTTYWRNELRTRFPGANNGLVYIPSGRTRDKQALLWAIGPRIEVPRDQAKKIGEILGKHGYVVSISTARYSSDDQAIVTVKPKAWVAANARLEKMERASQRQAWIADGLADALKALGAAEDEMEKRTLAEMTVKGYNLRRESIVDLLQSKERDVRTNVIGAMPVLKEYFESQGSTAWQEQVAQALKMQAKTLIELVRNESIYKRSDEAHVLAMVGLGTTDARVKWAVKEVSRMWLQSKAPTLEEGLRETAILISSLRNEKLDKPPVSVLSTIFAGRNATHICEILDTAIKEKKGDDLRSIVSAALMDSYRSVLLRTLGVMAWQIMSWPKGIDEDNVSEKALEAIKGLIPGTPKTAMSGPRI